MTELAVTTSGLTKRYGRDVLAVDRVDLRVARGEIYAFLGLNGAGKSTTIRMLLGMIRPTAGHAELFGERVARGRHRPLAARRPPGRDRDGVPGADRPREPRRRAAAGGGRRPAVRRPDDRAARPRAVRGPAGRHALARQPPAARARPGAAPRARAARARRAGQRPRPGRRDRDPRADPRPRPRARRDRLHVEPHPGRGRSARDPDRDRPPRPAHRGARQRRARGPPRSPARDRRPGPRRAPSDALRAAGLSPVRGRPTDGPARLELRDATRARIARRHRPPARRRRRPADPPGARPRIARGPLHPADRRRPGRRPRERAAAPRSPTELLKAVARACRGASPPASRWRRWSWACSWSSSRTPRAPARSGCSARRRSSPPGRPTGRRS